MGGLGVAFFAIGPQRCRMVTHLDVSRQDIDEAISRLSRFLSG